MKLGPGIQLKRFGALLISSLWYFIPNFGLKSALNLFLKNGGFQKLTWLPLGY